MFFWIFKIILYLPYRIIFPTFFVNRKELKKYRGKGVVFVCNHRSNSDAPTSFIVFNRRLSFLVKPSLMLKKPEYKEKKKFWYWFFSRGGCYPVVKGNDLGLIRFSLNELKKNHAMFIFPEGMRVFNPDDALALRNGSAMIAIKAGVPVVPVIMKKVSRPFNLNYIKIGQPIPTEEYQNKSFERSDMLELSDKIRDTMAEMSDGFVVQSKPKKWELIPSTIARGIITVDDKQLLLIKRIKKGKEYYVFPGGHVEKGENIKETVLREVKEETNADILVIRHIYKYDFNQKESAESGIHTNERGFGMQSFFYCTYKSGTIGPTDAEEYTDGQLERGTYEPVLVNLEEISNLTIKPMAIKQQLLKDLAKYGPRLARQTILVK